MKEHYAMRRIKARKKKTEILYIFFGIHGRKRQTGTGDIFTYLQGTGHTDIIRQAWPPISR